MVTLTYPQEFKQKAENVGNKVHIMEIGQTLAVE